MLRGILELRRMLRHRRLSADELREIQNRKLRALVRHASDNVPFYHRLFRSAGLSAEDVRTVDDLKRVPVTAKDDLRRAGLDSILTRGVSPGSCRRSKTSGSTGRPFETYLNDREHWIRRLLGFRRLLDVGLRPLDRVCTICDPTQLPSRRYRTSHISPLLPLAEQVERLRRLRPTILKAWPSSLRALLRHTDDRLGEFVRPRTVVASSEVCSKALRQRVHASMQAPLFEFYGAGEFGPIASECQSRRGLHVNADYLILECLKDGEPAGNGEVGSVALTSLLSFTMPFIRYEIGDACRLLDTCCSCGSHLPLIEAPVGRQDELVRLPNGESLPVSAIAGMALRPIEGIDHFRLIQETEAHFVLMVVFTTPPATAVLSELEARMLACLGKGASVDIQAVRFIDEEPGRKYKRFLSKVVDATA